MNNCKCNDWCRDGSIPLLSHHKKCEHYNPEKELTKIIQDLLKGIDCWASDEDGAHPDCWSAYKTASVAMGKFDVLEREGK